MRRDVFFSLETRSIHEICHINIYTKRTGLEAVVYGIWSRRSGEVNGNSWILSKNWKINRRPSRYVNSGIESVWDFKLQVRASNES